MSSAPPSLPTQKPLILSVVLTLVPLSGITDR
jgi:hypothetical protein